MGHRRLLRGGGITEADERCLTRARHRTQPDPRSAHVLGLQRLAGNQAVGSLTLQRWPGTHGLMAALAKHPYLFMSGLDRPARVLSYRLGGTSGPPVGGTAGGRARETNEVTVTLQGGDQSAALLQATSGAVIAHASIVQRGLKVLMDDVLVSGYSVEGASGGSPNETVTLSAGSISYEYGQ